jgi:choline/ethanolamine kinase
METPLQSEKVREKAYQLCREYLQGSWKLVCAKQLEIRQISGGLSNLVFYVGLPQGQGRGGREPHCILLRLFGELSQTPVHQYRMITETVVFTMLAERNLGPRLFGVFPGGRLEEFIPGHPLTTVEMRSQEFSEQIARNVALVHSLEVPVSKEPTWLADTMRTYLHRLSICPERVPEEEREHAVALANWDVRQEVDWLLGFLKTVDSPVVFSHNDINTGNILVREDPSSWDPVVFIDYEFAAYNYRAFDIANHFNEWMYDYGRKDFPYYYRRTDQYPSQKEQERWVRMYVQTYREQQQLQQENNQSPGPPAPPPDIEESRIMREVTVFSLASHMVWCLWGLKQGQTSSIPFAYYHFARDKLEDYREAKARAETLLLEAEVVSS